MSMVKIVNRDITTVTAGILCHGVNCQGAMGSGVAKAIKEKWPEVYQIFKNSDVGRDMLGAIKMVKPSGYPDLTIYNCYTQEYYGRDGKRYASLDAVRESLYKIFRIAETTNETIHLPKIGCGLGGLDWDSEVSPVITKYSESFEVPVYVYEI